jgi:hypothetical protein
MCETCRKRMDCKLYEEAVKMGATIDQCPEYRQDHTLDSCNKTVMEKKQ